MPLFLPKVISTRIIQKILCNKNASTYLLINRILHKIFEVFPIKLKGTVIENALINDRLRVSKVQWNLPKADTHGRKNFVHFREVSALERFCLFWPETRENHTPKTSNLLGIPMIFFTPPQQPKKHL